MFQATQQLSNYQQIRVQSPLSMSIVCFKAYPPSFPLPSSPPLSGSSAWTCHLKGLPYVQTPHTSRVTGPAGSIGSWTASEGCFFADRVIRRPLAVHRRMVNFAPSCRARVLNSCLCWFLRGRTKECPKVTLLIPPSIPRWRPRAGIDHMMQSKVHIQCSECDHMHAWYQNAGPHDLQI